MAGRLGDCRARAGGALVRCGGRQCALDVALDSGGTLPQQVSRVYSTGTIPTVHAEL